MKPGDLIYNKVYIDLYPIPPHKIVKSSAQGFPRITDQMIGIVIDVEEDTGWTRCVKLFIDGRVGWVHKVCLAVIP